MFPCSSHTVLLTMLTFVTMVMAASKHSTRPWILIGYASRNIFCSVLVTYTYTQVCANVAGSLSVNKVVRC